MTGRHRRTLEALFSRPTPSDLRWSRIASLLKALGAEMQEREGSRVAFVLKGRVLVIHKPHPVPELPRGSARDVRDFLDDLGIRP